MPTYLDDILAQHRGEAARDTRSLEQLQASVEGLLPGRDFAQALSEHSARGERVAVIAEVKRRSPSAGDLSPGLDPGDLARLYEKGGAACLSVLTDAPHFGGSRDDLLRARAAVELPVLRKDFTVSVADVYDARAMGADALLLIVAALSSDDLEAYLGLARDLGLSALVEVHDEDELARALQAGARIIGVNQRDLRTFEVDTSRALSLVEQIPAEVLRVAESGIKSSEQAHRLADAGYDAILVGEAFVTAADPVQALQSFAGTRQR